MVRIFQTKSGNLQELKEEKKGGKYFDLEKSIQGLVENNLSEIFTDLEFVKSEHQIGDLRPDTIAFDSGRQSFVIIEYKNKQNESLIEQGISYYQLLQEKQGEFVLLYNKLKNKNFDVDEVNWDDTRIIFISPTFSKFQKKASGFHGLPTEMWEIKKYENGFFTLNRVDSPKEYSSLTKKDKSKEKSYVTLAEYTEDDYLDGRWGTTVPSENIKKLWFIFKKILEDKFENIEFIQKKIYGGFYSKIDNSCICTIVTAKNFLNLSYATTKKNFLPQSGFVTYTTKGHHGIGHYISKLSSVTDIEQAIPHILKVYQLKVKE